MAGQLHLQSDSFLVYQRIGTHITLEAVIIVVWKAVVLSSRKENATFTHITLQSAIIVLWKLMNNIRTEQKLI